VVDQELEKKALYNEIRKTLSWGVSLTYSWELLSLDLTESSFLQKLSFFFIKCKKYIDQKEQDKLAIQAGNQQNSTNSSQGNKLP
jgi:hypothetical protein